MKKIISYLMICICCLSLCGCGNYPAMSDSDYDLVAEYAAGLLLEKSTTSGNRLMDVEDALQLLEQEKQEEVVEETVEETVIEPEEEKEEINKEEPTVIDKTESIVEVPAAPVNEAMGISALTVQFTGIEIKDSYPDGGSGFFALDAKEGNKLLVARVELINNTDSDVSVNMLENNVSFKVSLDGNGYKYAMSTLLLDDLSTYVGTIQPGKTVEVVLLSEWKESELSEMTNPYIYVKGAELSGSYPMQ